MPGCGLEAECHLLSRFLGVELAESNRKNCHSERLTPWYGVEHAMNKCAADGGKISATVDGK
jgi:hypothetical protein